MLFSHQSSQSSHNNLSRFQLFTAASSRKSNNKMNTVIDCSLVLGLLLALPAPTWPFSASPQRPNSPICARMRQKGNDIDDALHHFQLDSRMTSTNNDWSRSSSRHQQKQHQQLGMDIDFLEAGVVAHQSLLNSMATTQQHLNDHHNLNHLVLMSSTKLELNETQGSNPSISAPPPKTTSFVYPIVLSDTWKARLLLLLSAALYGTNFTMVKNLDDIMPVGISSTIRFGFAALVMLPLLIRPLADELAKERRRIKITRDTGEKRSISSSSSGRIDDDRIENVIFQFLEEPSRLSVGLAGMEIGLYNSIGYIAQAVGLRTTTASKVRCLSLCIS